LEQTQRPMPRVRQHSRVSLVLPSTVAKHGTVPLAFYPCIIEDISLSGALCRLAPPLAEDTPREGTLLQLKFALPETGEVIFAVTRVVRIVEPGLIGVI